jgi:large subunit ribosomal protein L13
MPRTTHSATRDEALKGRAWWVVDATDQTVGRLATRLATILKGKHKPIYTPSIDTGDFVVVVNADKVRFTGKKETDKLYFTHTMHPGGVKMIPPAKLRERHPEGPLVNAVKRMLPRSALGRQMMTKLKVYAGDTHPHAAQKPQALVVTKPVSK